MTYGPMRHASALYQQNSVSGGVESADPHQLVGMLLDGALDRIAQARGHVQHGNVAAKGTCISKAVAIVGELRDSLDHKVDPSFSQRLESLYEYVIRRLLYAQLHDDLAALDEASRLLAPVREGWQGIRGAYLAQAEAQKG
ncbi:flagellar export chaperone FliS [Dyella lutea]|uniref:Flagellar secretion chaperone FliS n=1 Tax=Dyella lutea TaxID=2950441 RepID=A0ABT1F9G8_9GAMM|nr:flagellar export chaperone FliS [Dyella lutea]MCP1373760.1 flagellar export chaperone FliS [Dyella lutea]